MKQVIASLRSASPYSQSRKYDIPRDQGEGQDDWYKRTWRNHCHFDEAQNCFIPPGAFTASIQQAAKYLSIPIPGKGKATYTKHFDAGVSVLQRVMLGTKLDDVENEELWLSPRGIRNDGTRVKKYYPLFRQWSGDVEYTVFDETVLQTYVDRSNGEMSVFEHVLREAGKFVGIGRWSPAHRGLYGRWEVEEVVIG